MNNSIDYFPANNRPLYDWEGLYIRLECNFESIPLNNNIDQEFAADRQTAITFLHEYIHFLQNFATNWGVPIFTDLAFSYLRIGASSSSFKEDIYMPLDLSKYNDLLADGFSNRSRIIDKLNIYNKIDYIDGGTLREINCNFSNEKFLILNNGLLNIEIGVKVIREHMARLGSYLFLDITDSEIHENNIKISSKNNVPYMYQSEYWVLFELFFQSNKVNNIAKGVFLLSNFCLSTTTPTKIIRDFIQYYLRFTNQYKININLDEFVNFYFSTKENLRIINESTESVKHHCNTLLKLLEKPKEDNDLALFVNNIITYSLSNIETSSGGLKLFPQNENFKDFNYWKNLISIYGSGIIKFNDETRIMGKSSHINQMSDSFMFFLATSLVVKKITMDDFKECPFLYNFPICRASFYDSDDCIRNPFNMVNKVDQNGKCLFGNAVSLLGLSNRVKRV